MNYEDDGETYGYREGDYHEREIALADTSFTMGRASGSRAGRFTRLRLCFHGFCFGPSDFVCANGENVPIEASTFRWCAPLPSFDPLDKEDRDPYGSAGVHTVDLEYTSAELDVTWENSPT